MVCGRLSLNQVRPLASSTGADGQLLFESAILLADYGHGGAATEFSSRGGYVVSGAL